MAPPCAPTPASLPSRAEGSTQQPTSPPSHCCRLAPLARASHPGQAMPTKCSTGEDAAAPKRTGTITPYALFIAIFVDRISKDPTNPGFQVCGVCACACVAPGLACLHLCSQSCWDDACYLKPEAELALPLSLCPLVCIRQALQQQKATRLSIASSLWAGLNDTQKVCAFGLCACPNEQRMRACPSCRACLCTGEVVQRMHGMVLAMASCAPHEAYITIAPWPHVHAQETFYNAMRPLCVQLNEEMMSSGEKVGGWVKVWHRRLWEPGQTGSRMARVPRMRLCMARVSCMARVATRMHMCMTIMACSTVGTPWAPHWLSLVP